jgi:predicted polyphosphate/ATP-dependent NAD kinase
MKTFTAKFANQFVDKPGYSFKTMMDIEEGDLVVVDCSAGLAVVVVETIDEIPNPRATRWAFNMVDTRPLDQLIELDLRKAAIVKLLDAKLRARKETDKYLGLAESDPEAKGLLSELEVLNKSTK